MKTIKVRKLERLLSEHPLQSGEINVNIFKYIKNNGDDLYIRSFATRYEKKIMENI